MPLNLLAISIGNTRTRLGTFVDGKLDGSTPILNSDRIALGEAIEKSFAAIKDYRNAMIVIASVNPPLVAPITHEITKRTGLEPQRVEQDYPIPIGRQLDREAIVGEDRLLNAAAAYDTLKQGCVIVDAGTAITVDFVDGLGTFHGGAVGPGAQMMLDSLHEHIAHLPEVKFDAPEEAIGHNTAEAMKSAVFYGLRGMVRELTEHYAEAAGTYPMVIATGGNAELLFGNFELIERIVPDLTLLGIAAAVRLDREGVETEE